MKMKHKWDGIRNYFEIKFNLKLFLKNIKNEKLVQLVRSEKQNFQSYIYKCYRSFLLTLAVFTDFEQILYIVLVFHLLTLNK